MKTFAVLVFASLWIIHVRVSNADYRYRRMPPQPPRAPPVPPYLKKWHNTHMRQSLSRPRPIPVHLGVQQQQQQQQHQQFKKPVGPPIPKRSLPVANVRPKLVTPAPVQNWNTNQVYLRQAPPQEKPFLSSPKVQVSEYEYHIQTNQIPNHSNLIKQIDEKGPIHTIPAPNLSPADKPAHLDIQAPKQQTLVEIQKSHQYQVTEVPDIIKHTYKQQYPIQSQEHVQPPQLQLQTEALVTPNDQLSQVSQQDLYKFFQNYQQPLIESYNIPALQQPQLQEHLMQQQAYQTFSQQPIFQSDPTYLTQFQQTVQQKDIKPEFHTFNYEEPTQKSVSSQVSAEYSVQPEQHNPLENQYQSYFDHQPNTVANNNVEPEINYFQNFNYPGITEDVNPASFYSSLPNKQAADSLASLQEAGKRKVNAHEEIEGRDGSSMTIYVPDDSEENVKVDEQGNQSNQSRKDNEGPNYEYDDGYLQEDDTNGEISDSQGDSFGSRIKPKKY